jgi:ribonuclease HI
MSSKFILNTDGGARGNPGPAAIGMTLKSKNGESLCEYKEKIGVTTNNVAEYMALIKGLELALQNNVQDIECVLDSELVVKQINGLYRVKEESLKILHANAKSLLEKFRSHSVEHVRRKDNSRADKLVNEALDNK